MVAFAEVVLISSTMKIIHSDAIFRIHCSKGTHQVSSRCSPSVFRQAPDLAANYSATDMTRNIGVILEYGRQ